MKTLLALCLLAFVPGCFASRPATTVLEVASDVPAGAVQVGPVLPLWIDNSGGCNSPPPAVRMQAQRWGADYLVADVKHETVRDGRTICLAHGYAVGS